MHCEERMNSKEHNAKSIKPSPVTFSLINMANRAGCKKINALIDFKYGTGKIRSKCPICSSNEGILLYEVSPEIVAGHFAVKERELERFSKIVKNLRRLWKGKGCKIIRCANCAFCYAFPFVAGNAEFYNLLFTKPGIPAWKWEFDVTNDALVRLLQAKSSRDVRLVEIGSGQGTFVKGIAPRLLPKENILCVEYSDSCRKIIEDYGIRSIAKDVRQIGKHYVGQFSVVCMFQVLEHMDDLDRLFKSLNKITEKNADYFIAVPNEKMIEFQEIYGALLEVPPHHTGRWNKRAFEMLCKKHNLALMEHKEEPCRRLPAFRQFVIYKYQKKRIREGSFPHKVSVLTNKPVRRALEYGLILYYSVISLPLIPWLEGNSQWVHLRKL